MEWEAHNVSFNKTNEKQSQDIPSLTVMRKPVNDTQNYMSINTSR